MSPISLASLALWLAGRLALAALLALPAAAQDPAPGRVQIIHNAPDPALATVDVYLNEVRAEGLDDLAFRTATPYLAVEGGRVISVVIAADTSMGFAGPLAVGAFVSESGIDHQVIIEGLAEPYAFAPNPGGASPRLTVRVLRRGPASFRIEAGDPRIEMAFYHGSPDAPAYPYDVRSWTGSGIFGLHADYGSSIRASFPGADVHYRFTLPGQSRVDLDAERLNVHAGQSALLMLSGFYDPAQNQQGPALGLFVVREDGAVESVWGDAYSTAAASGPEADARQGLVVSPNPVRDRAVLTLARPAGAGATVEVFDARGRSVLREPAPPSGPLAVATGGWPAGTYLVRVTTPNGLLASGRFTVVR